MNSILSKYAKNLAEAALVPSIMRTNLEGEIIDVIKGRLVLGLISVILWNSWNYYRVLEITFNDSNYLKFGVTYRSILS